jgi:hypothetical protein
MNLYPHKTDGGAEYLCLVLENAQRAARRILEQKP